MEEINNSDRMLDILKDLETVFDAEVDILIDDRSKQVINFTYDDDADHPPSFVLFPTIIKKFQTGSRAEYLYTDKSDYDDIYEIGPGLIRDLRDKGKNGDFEGFYWKPTKHEGFYTIQDSKGHYLYPESMKQKLGPLFLLIPKVKDNLNHILRNSQPSFDFLSHTRTGASIPSGKTDFVIGMRLEKWPREIAESMRGKLEEGIDTQLFLITKNYPGSDHEKLEWRISFSMLEKKILLNLPAYQRKAYLLWKNKKRDSNIKTYHLKTVLMKVACEFQGSSNPPSLDIVSFKNKLEEELQMSYDRRKLTNFFLPEQNLIDVEDQLLNAPSTVPLRQLPFLSERFGDDNIHMILARTFFNFMRCFVNVIVEIYRRQFVSETLNESFLKALFKGFVGIKDVFQAYKWKLVDLGLSDLQQYVKSMQDMPLVPIYIPDSVHSSMRRPRYFVSTENELVESFERINEEIENAVERIESDNGELVSWFQGIIQVIYQCMTTGEVNAENLNNQKLFELTKEVKIFGNYTGTLVLPHNSMRSYYEKEMNNVLQSLESRRR